MGNMYRVLIEGPDGETVVDLTAPVEMLRQFAPAAVGAALGAESVQVGEPPKMAMDAPTVAEGEQKQRRPRRTKAEMEAARAAEPSTPESPAIPDPEPAPMAMAGGGRGPEPEVYNPFGSK